MSQTVLVNQPSAAPTRKVAAVGVTGAIGAVVAGLLVAQWPALSVACSEEIGLALTVTGLGLAQAAAATLSGYFKRNALPDPGVVAPDVVTPVVVATVPPAPAAPGAQEPQPLDGLTIRPVARPHDLGGR